MDEQEAIYAELGKCSKIVLRLSALYHDDPKSWSGTIAERLEYLVDKVIKDLDIEKNKFKATYDANLYYKVGK